MKKISCLLLFIVGASALHKKCRILGNSLICKSITESEKHEIAHETITSVYMDESPIALTASFFERFPNIDSFSAIGATAIAPDAFKNSPNLKYVFFYGCSFGVLPNDLLDNTNIVSFETNNSPIAVSKGPIFTSNSLEFLKLTNASIQFLHPAAFSGLPNLLEVQLAYNQIEQLPVTLFNNNKKLVLINLRYNKLLKSAPAEVFKPLSDDIDVNLEKTNFDCTEKGTKEMIQVFKQKKINFIGGCAKPKGLDLEEVQ